VLTKQKQYVPNVIPFKGIQNKELLDLEFPAFREEGRHAKRDLSRPRPEELKEINPLRASSRCDSKPFPVSAA
jgi:hypothetical protein